MHDVVILGAGELGGSIAHVCARRELVNRIHLIDPSGRIAEGKALDIMQAGPIEGFHTRVSGSTDISRAAGASIVILADPAASTEPDAAAALLLLRQVSLLASRSVVVCAGANHREVVDRAVRELRFPRLKVVGSAPEALAGALRALVALEADSAPSEVALALIGIPAAHTVVAWEDATIRGFAATRVLDEPARRRLAAQVVPLWPPGSHALATAATEAVAALAGRSFRSLTCFLAPDDGSGTRRRTAAVPVRLGPGGVIGAPDPPLSEAGRIAFDNATLV